MKFKRSIPYQILIDPTPNGGFIVTVGCAKFPYHGYTQLIRDLTEYLENPVDVEKQYNMDIARLGRVHIGTVPDITVTPYGPGSPVFSATALSRMADDMVKNQERQEAERKKNPQVVLTPNTEL